VSKYAPLGEYLARQNRDSVSLSFGEVEKILGFKLPHSAYQQRAWWSNNGNNNVMTRIWREAEFRSRDVDMERRKVVFQRKKVEHPAPINERQESMKRLRAHFTAARQHQETPRHPLRGALKGVIRLARGTDLTKPTGNWNDR
jgi:hypothetical protein